MQKNISEYGPSFSIPSSSRPKKYQVSKHPWGWQCDCEYKQYHPGEDCKHIRNARLIETENYVPYYLNGVKIGVVKGVTYLTHRDSKKHFFLKHNGYAIEHSVLLDLYRMGVQYIMVYEDKIKLFETHINTYLHGIIAKEEGFEEQRVVRLEDMDKVKL